jgi:hypothetical protein
METIDYQEHLKWEMYDKRIRQLELQVEYLENLRLRNNETISRLGRQIEEIGDVCPICNAFHWFPYGDYLHE